MVMGATYLATKHRKIFKHISLTIENFTYLNIQPKIVLRNL